MIKTVVVRFPWIDSNKLECEKHWISITKVLFYSILVSSRAQIILFLLFSSWRSLTLCAGVYECMITRDCGWWVMRLRWKREEEYRQMIAGVQSIMRRRVRYSSEKERKQNKNSRKDAYNIHNSTAHASLPILGEEEGIIQIFVREILHSRSINCCQRAIESNQRKDWEDFTFPRAAECFQYGIQEGKKKSNQIRQCFHR